MANYKDKNRKKVQKQGVHAYIVIIIAIVAIVLGVIIGILVVKSGANKSTKDVSQSAVTESKSAADGEIVDYMASKNIALGDYQNRTIEVTPSQDDIYAEMQSEADEITVKNDKTVQKGDYVFIDYVGYLNGEVSEDLQAADVTLKIGDYEYVEDFENGLIGKEVGKTHTIQVKFASDYDDATVAGQTVTFSVTINGKFDDKYAVKASNEKCRTVSEYIEYLKKKLKKDNEETKNDIAWSDLSDDTTVHSYPKDLLSETMQDLKQQYESFAEVQGSTYEELLEGFGMDEEAVKETAQDTVKEHMMAKTIAKNENLTLTDEQYQNYLMQAMEYTEQDNMTLKALINEYKSDYGSRPKDDMLIELAKDYVGNHATIK